MHSRKKIFFSKKIFTVLQTLCILTSSLQAFDSEPWMTKALELQPQLSYRFQNYPSVNSSKKRQHYHSADHFLMADLGLAVEPFEIQLEAVMADTRRRSFGMDHFALTGRYKYMNDILGDPLTVTFGGTYIQAWKWALYDISSFHHGLYEFEAHTSVGKEFSYGSEWLWRWWTLFALGLSERGAPWLRAEAFVEKNYCDSYLLRAFVKSLWGFGSRPLHVHHFHGYGAVNHQSIELGIGAHYTFENQGTIKLEYARRIFSRNFPSRANNVVLSYLYPFGL